MTGSDGNRKFSSCMFRNSSAVLPALESCAPTTRPTSAIQTQPLTDEAQGFTTEGWSLGMSSTFSLERVRSLDAARRISDNGTEAEALHCWNICTSIGDDCCAPVRARTFSREQIDTVRFTRVASLIHHSFLCEWLF